MNSLIDKDSFYIYYNLIFIYTGITSLLLALEIDFNKRFNSKIVNNVATPTTMNSYLSVGIIPIYTNVIDSFNENLILNDFQIKLDHQLSSEEIAIEVLTHHKKNIDVNSLIETLTIISRNYYNDEVYINNLISKI